MQNFGFYIIPACLIIILIYGIHKKVPIFDVFLSGAEDGFKSTISLIPTFIGLITSISMLKASGALDTFAQLLEPICLTLKIPSQIMPLMLMRPISGGGSTALLNDIFTSYGADGKIGTLASMIMGSTETTFYTLTVYFGAIKIKNTRHALICSVAADIFAILTAIVLANLFIF